MPNTISSRTYRDKYRRATLDHTLRLALVAEKVCEVDRSEVKRIQSPYGSQPTTVVQALAGTYTPATFTTTDDTLSVDDEFIVSEHIFDFEETLTAFDLFASRVDVMSNSVATKIDQFVVNNLCEDGTGAYTTPAGGFTTAANIPVIMSNLAASVMGYAETYKGLFLIIENTDVVGFAQSQVAQGFSYSDAALRNGFMNSYMGIDIYVVRTGTFTDATVGTKTWTNAGHRVFGVKNVATYAAPRGVQFEEKGVAGKTGMEVVAYGYIGFKLWAPYTALIVDITLTA
jgi:hypothetical protein